MPSIPTHRELALVSDSGSRFPITQSGVGLVDYPLRTSSGTSVAEQWEVRVTAAALYTPEEFFQEATRFWAGERARGERVYIEDRQNVYKLAHRAELLDFRLQARDDSLRPWMAPARHAVILGYVERTPWFESSTEIELPLAAYNQVGSSVGGVTVFNHYQADENEANYVALRAYDILGDVPVPARLELTNLNATTVDRLWVGHAVEDHTVSDYRRVQAEDATAGTDGTVTDVPEVVASGGAYTNLAWTGTGAQHVASWTLSAARLAALRSRRCRLLMRCQGPPEEATLRVQWKVSVAGVALWEGAWVPLTTNHSVQDMGEVRLFAENIPLTNPMSLTLEVWGRGETGLHEIQVDDLHLFPTATRRYYQRHYALPGLGQGDVLRDDGPRDELYVYDPGSASQMLSGFAASGPRPLLIPGKAQRLYFLAELTNGVAPTSGQSFTVKAYFRPRVRSLVL